jgi:hypothetical protein
LVDLSIGFSLKATALIDGTILRELNVALELAQTEAAGDSIEDVHVRRPTRPTLQLRLRRIRLVA